MTPCPVKPMTLAEMAWEKHWNDNRGKTPYLHFQAGFSAGKPHGQREMLEKIKAEWDNTQTILEFSEFLDKLAAELAEVNDG